MGRVIMIIDDPQNGKSARVDLENRLRTFTTSEPYDKHRNREGNVFSVYFQVTPAAANDYFYYFKNNGLNDVFITDVRIISTVASTITYEKVSGTPTYVAGTDATTTNRNFGSSIELDAENKFDTDITGLTSNGIVFFEGIDTPGKRYHLRTTSNIIIPQGKAIAFKRVAATGLLTVLVSYVVDVPLL
jgi:hypothetical protein